MTRIPLFNRLDVESYGMFPGTSTEPGLHVTFRSGLTLILGANGLGKTTLITLLYRMCTGPYDLPGLPSSEFLGTQKLDAKRLARWDQRIFASRVADEAASATATLEFSIGSDNIEVTRNLSSLSVTHLKVNQVELQPTDDAFQKLIAETTALPTFGDWILILRYLIFYFEDRRALVWDPSAQRQILRLLLLPTSVAAAWATKEREVLELDSRVRNLQNALNREEGIERQAKAKVRRGKTIMEQLKELDKTLRAETAQLEAVSDALPAAEGDRQRARLRALTLEQDYDSARRALERLQLIRIGDAFPSQDESARYILSRLITTEVCQTCGNHVPEVAASLKRIMESSRCVVCGSDLKAALRSRRGVQAELTLRSSEMNRLHGALTASRVARTAAESTYDSLLTDFTRLDASVAQIRASIAGLVRRLPPDEQAIRKQSTEVTTLRSRLLRLKDELDALRAEFEDQVRGDMRRIARHRGAIIATFNEFAEGFLFESSQLKWAPHSSRVGQTGPTVDFPAFEFEMIGSDFPSPVRRTRPDEVSESQREFIDLAFRMTLIRIAGETRSGSLIIDAPESSLDAVFSERAATVLVRFANPELDNRVIVTSNLVDGQLIPKMLSEAGIESAADERVVDLLKIATPTSAVRQLSAEYERVRDTMFSTSRDLG